MLTSLLLLLSLNADAAEPINLGGLVDLAIKQNLGILALESGKEAAEANVAYAKSQYLPSPSFTYQRRSTNLNYMSVALDQPLWTGGRITAMVDKSLNSLAASDYAIYDKQLEVSFKVLDAYQLWLKSQYQASVYQKNIERLTDYLERVTRRYEQGVSTTADVQLVKTRISQLNSDYQTTRALADIAVTNLSQLLNEDVSKYVIEVEKNKTGEVITIRADKTRVFRAIIDNHPNILKLQKEMDAAEQEITISQSVAFPTLSARIEQSKDDLYTGLQNDARFLINLQYSPGAGGFSSMYQVDAAKHKLEELKKQKSNKQTELTSTLDNLYIEYKLGQSRLNVLGQAVNSSEIILDSYNRLFEAGKRSWLEVLNGAKELMQLELTQADEAVKFITNHYKMKTYLDIYVQANEIKHE